MYLQSNEQGHDLHIREGLFQYRLRYLQRRKNQSVLRDTGLHACEYVLDCTWYYEMGKYNRYFKAKAEGDIAEDGHETRIACTRLTLLKELTNRDIAKEAMLYMIHHVNRRITGRLPAIW